MLVNSDGEAEDRDAREERLAADAARDFYLVGEWGLPPELQAGGLSFFAGFPAARRYFLVAFACLGAGALFAVPLMCNCYFWYNFCSGDGSLVDRLKFVLVFSALQLGLFLSAHSYLHVVRQCLGTYGNDDHVVSVIYKNLS